jgi:hypothetical protein
MNPQSAKPSEACLGGMVLGINLQHFLPRFYRFRILLILFIGFLTY